MLRPAPYADCGGALALHLEAAVRLSGDLLGGRVLELGQRATSSSQPGPSVSSYADTDDTKTWWPPRPSRASASVSDLARDVAADVDGRVELATGEHARVAVAVGQQVLGLGEQPGAGLAAVQHG